MIWGLKGVSNPQENEIRIGATIQLENWFSCDLHTSWMV